MIIAVFSIGQFISSKLDVLKTGFQNWFSTQGKEVSGDDVWKWMAANLAPLRTADITLEQFCEKFNENFQVNISFNEFSKIFNSMCQIDQASLDRVSKFKDFLSGREDIKFVLVSHTNYSHLNYILEQLKDLLPDSQSNIINNDKQVPETAQILFAPSMTSKCTEHPDTLKYALGRLQVAPDDQVVSFLNTIKTFAHDEFSYVEAGKDLENVMDALPAPSRSLTY